MSVAVLPGSGTVSDWLQVRSRGTRNFNHTPNIVLDSPVAGFIAFAESLLEQRVIERNAAASRLEECLQEVSKCDAAFASALKMCDRAHQYTYAIRSKLESMKKENGGVVVDEKLQSLPSASDEIFHLTYHNLLSVTPVDKDYIENLHFARFLNKVAPPNAQCLLAIATAAHEECCAEKVAAEHRYRRCLLQYRLYEADLENAEAACVAAEDAINSLVSYPPQHNT
ncbi:hypothetical protein BV22DRAFT_1133518 [Leucogyrophana mollusca]|uniref:Uncharacterized protein n=1 Tax=Leucogyrophana mollusca TaxID=85980 RepID=A0ACB8B3Y9_9AGAM|nr:hypothetical protein BV22DRAFT_1133518 [Leucogyrophana mollusca]